ncbi:thioredoxin family protein [Aureivirga sp. CE67]|uniref:thioredoxin family protein n=1 Tax=Aureivirga sp. CE67 TaxID=1788983 RepID=UPI0018CA9D6B|nr:thioredoxin fold domain-containing protein [Aureivirga sp. CE67]
MKKTILFLFISLLSLGSFAQHAEINWMTVDEALEAQKKEPKKIMMDAYTVWCGPCKMLDKNTFQNPDVVAYVNKNFYAVKFNAQGKEEVNYKGTKFTNPGYQESRKNSRNSSHEFSRALKISAYPTIIFFNEEGSVLMNERGYKSPQQLEFILKFLATDKYKEIKSKEEFMKYRESFVPAFK